MQYESIGSFYARRIPPLNHQTHVPSRMPSVAIDEEEQTSGPEKLQEHEPEREGGEEEGAGERQPEDGEKEQPGEGDKSDDGGQDSDHHDGGRDDNAGEGDREGDREGGREGDREGDREGGREDGDEKHRDTSSDMDEDATESEGQEDDVDDEPDTVKQETGEPEGATDDEHGSVCVSVHEQPEYMLEAENDTIVVKFEPPSADSDVQIDDLDEDSMTEEMPDDLPEEHLGDLLAELDDPGQPQTELLTGLSEPTGPTEPTEPMGKAAGLADPADLVEPLVKPPAKLPAELRADEQIEPMDEDEEMTLLHVPSPSIQAFPHPSLMPLQHRHPRLRRPKPKSHKTQKTQKSQHLLQPQPRPLLVTSPLAERQALLRRRPLLQPRPQTTPPVLPHMAPQLIPIPRLESPRGSPGTIPATSAPRREGQVALQLQPSPMAASTSGAPDTAPQTPSGPSRPSVLQPRPPPLLRINAQISQDPDDPGAARTPAGMDAFWESALQRLHQQKQKQLLLQTIPQLPLPPPPPTQPRSTLRSLQPRPQSTQPLPPTSVPQQPLPPPKVTISPPAYLFSSPDGTLMDAFEYRQQGRMQAIEAARDRMRRLRSGEPLLTSRRGPLAAAAAASASSPGAGDASHGTENTEESGSADTELMAVDQADLAPDSAALPLPGAYRGRPCPCCNMYIRRDRSILPEEDYGRNERRKDYIPISLLYDMLPRPPKGYPFFDD